MVGLFLPYLLVLVAHFLVVKNLTKWGHKDCMPSSRRENGSFNALMPKRTPCSLCLLRPLIWDFQYWSAPFPIVTHATTPTPFSLSQSQRKVKRESGSSSQQINREGNTISLGLKGGRSRFFGRLKQLAKCSMTLTISGPRMGST